MIYFDNAATSFPKPQGVVAAMEDALLTYGANPGRSGHLLSIETARRVYACRASLARLFGAQEPEQVAFTQNCTHAINLVLKGLLKPGDHVVISDLEHNAVWRPVDTLARRGVITYDILEVAEEDEETAARLETLLRPETRLVAVTAGSNVFGIVLPLAAIAAVTKEHGTLLLVDAAQAAGVLPLNLGTLPIDFLCMPGHKGLYGPTGTGALITTHGDLLDTVMEGGTGSNSLEPVQPEFMPDKLECGTVNAAGIQALGAGLDYVLGKGTDAIYRQQLSLADRAWTGLRERGALLYTSRPQMGRQLPVLAFNLPGFSGEETCAMLDREGFCLRGGYHCAPLAHKKMGTLGVGAARLSFGCFNTAAEVDQLLDAVERIRAKRRI